MSDVVKAAERVMRIRDGESLATVYHDPQFPNATNYQLAFECDVQDVAYAYLAGPQWMNRPSGPGLWVCMADGKRVHQPQVIDLNEADIKRGAPFYAPRVYGPIPTDGAGRLG